MQNNHYRYNKLTGLGNEIPELSDVAKVKTLVDAEDQHALESARC
jgi:hypothetical protein